MMLIKEIDEMQQQVNSMQKALINHTNLKRAIA